MTERTRSGTSPLRGLRVAAAPFAKTALLRLGGYAAIRRVLPSRRLAILRYHAVCGPEGHSYADPGICVTPASFEQHIRCLTSNYTVLPLDLATRRLTAGQPLPRNAVAITFDDGYADNLQAARILEKYGATATFYVTAGCLDDGEPFWPAELRHLMRAIPSAPVSLEAGSIRVELDLTSNSGRHAAVRVLTRTFKQHPIPVREQLRVQLRRLAPAPPMNRVMLTWDELRQMQAMGMTVGSHTMTHPNLPNAGLEAAEREIRESKAMLEERLGVAVTMFSYPNGGAERYMTPEVARLVRDAGFEAATTSRNALAGAKSNPLALERVQVTERLEDLVFALEIERFAFKPQPRPGEVE